MPFYAQCANCGHEFESRLINFGPGVPAIRMTVGSVAETCPRCGGRARTMEGQFNMDSQGRVDVLSGPQWTRDLVVRMTPAQARKIHTVATWAEAELAKPDVDEERVRERIDQVVERNAPVLKKFLDVMLSQRAGTLYQLLAFILTVVVLFAPQLGGGEPVPDPGITEDQMRDLFEQYFAPETDSDTPTPPNPGPEAPTPEPPPTKAG
ncbi:hypothetical protein ACPW96_11805 [Micromonospora sp. DT81.3]|uniref:hypothetical protein n=1 Tax=Micromonospora sp. DT81.3 TaxID=3416523 RepID=UPI003CEEB320